MTTGKWWLTDSSQNSTVRRKLSGKSSEDYCNALDLKTDKTTTPRSFCYNLA